MSARVYVILRMCPICSSHLSKHSTEPAELQTYYSLFCDNKRRKPIEVVANTQQLKGNCDLSMMGFLVQSGLLP
ncbi:hypothetical protein Csa_019678 [Cucumis sativus]|nr:hypothetical protein Csa_019678 [Cucumis sativus]